MARRFREEAARRGLPHLVVSGPHEERLAAAVRAVDRLPSRGWEFGEPLRPARG